MAPSTVTCTIWPALVLTILTPGGYESRQEQLSGGDGGGDGGGEAGGGGKWIKLRTADTVPG